MKKLLVSIGAGLLTAAMALAVDYDHPANPSQQVGHGARSSSTATGSIAISSCDGAADVNAVGACQIGSGSNGVPGTIKYRGSYLLMVPINGYFNAAYLYGNIPWYCLTNGLTAAMAADGVPAADLTGNIDAARMTNGGPGAIAGQAITPSSVDSAGDLSTWHQYVVRGPDQSVMLRVVRGTFTNGQPLVTFPQVFTGTPYVFPGWNEDVSGYGTNAISLGTVTWSNFVPKIATTIATSAKTNCVYWALGPH